MKTKNRSASLPTINRRVSRRPLLMMLAVFTLALGTVKAQPSSWITYTNNIPLNATVVQNASVADLAYVGPYGSTTYYCQDYCPYEGIIQSVNATTITLVPLDATLSLPWNATFVYYMPSGQAVYYWLG